ncbi:hypothetical protein C8R43DRAFT_998741 [Mycena crocata]|nr:hypothetical protein C8R43DRAFT_998741 [Mycena crocata]
MIGLFRKTPTYNIGLNLMIASLIPPWLVESVIETFTKDITADVFIRQILYATLDVFFVDCSEPDALESFVFNGSEFNRRYVDTWQPLFVGVNEYNNKPAWIKAGVALFEGLADAYGVKFLPGRSLAEQFESRLFRLANDSDSLSDLLDVLIASGMKPLANAVLNKAMLAAELDVARKLVYPQDEHVVLVHGLVASLQESCAGRGLVTKGGAAALFVEWAYLKLARQKLSSSTRRVKSIPLFLHWFHRYSGFGLSPRLAAMLSKNFFTTSRSAMPFVVAVLPRDTPFHVLINESIFDVCSSNNGENSCLIPFHEILAVSLCLDPTFSRGPLPLDRIPMKGYHVLWTKIFPDGSHLSGRVLDAQRKRDEWNAAAQENARVVLEEVGDMIDSVRVGTASTYTSQRMFPPRIQPTIEAWRTTLRKAAGAAPLSIRASTRPLNGTAVRKTAVRVSKTGPPGRHHETSNSLTAGCRPLTG